MDSLDKNYQFSHPYKKYDLYTIHPTSSSISNLNKSGEIRFEHKASSTYLDISNSYISFEIEIEELEDGEGITLENDFFPSMFSQMKLSFGSSDVELIQNPGIYSTMLNHIMTNKNYFKHEGQISAWIPDGYDRGDNFKYKAYKLRKEIYNKTKSFKGSFPLNKLFGFLECYNRLLYLTPVHLYLYREISNERIFYGGLKANNDPCEAKINLKSIELNVPEIQYNSKTEQSIIERFLTDKPIKINYLNRLCNHINVPEGSSFSFNPCTMSKRPKHIIIGFKDTNISFQKNNNLFLIKGLKSIQLKLNNVYYPMNRMSFDSEKNDLVLPYNAYKNMSKKYTDFSSLSLMDFKNSYPIFCFDVNAQDDALLSSNCMITK